MTSRRWWLCAPILAALLAGRTSAQTERGEQKLPPEQEKQEKEQTQNQMAGVPMFRRSGEIVGASLANEKHETIGEVQDLIVNTQNGQVTGAVLKVDKPEKKVVVVPVTALTWNQAHKHFHVSQEQLASGKPFDENRLEDFHAGPKDASGRKSSQEPGMTDPTGKNPAEDPMKKEPQDGAGQEKRERPAEPAEMRGPACCELVSKLSDCKVKAGPDNLGSCGDLYVDMNDACVGFCTVTLGDVVGIGGKTHPIPWAAVRVEKMEKTPDLRVQNADRKKVEGSPRLRSKEGQELNDPDFRMQVYEFYGVQKPAYDSGQTREKGPEKGMEKQPQRSPTPVKNG